MKEKEYHGLGYVWHNLEYLLAAVFATIMLIALFVQVVARFVFNNPIGWTEELAVTSFVMMVYIGSIGATRDDSHLKLELFINMASPKGKQVLLIVGDIVFSLMNLLLSYGLLNVTINLKKYGLPIVVALNMFPSDTEEEKKVAFEACKEAGVPVAESTVFADGGEGGLDLGEKVLAAIDQGSNYKPLYDLDLSLKEKIETIAKEIYGADGVAFDGAAAKELAHIEEMGYGKMPVCIAKTPVSFSDDPSKLGAPSGFTLHVREVKVSAGAGFVVALTGKIMTMPGLPRRPAAERIDVDDKGNITGLF